MRNASLKESYSLNARIEPLDLATNQVYRVTDEVDAGTLDHLDLDKETTFVCLDTALDDSKKVNLALQCLLKVI